MRTICLALALGWLMMAGLGSEKASAEHHEGGPKILQVFAIDADAKNRGAVLTRFKALQGILSSEGQPGFRVWMASYAGDNVGRMFLTVERANYADFGSNAVKVQSSAAIQKWVDDMNNSGLARVVSQSLLTEVTP